MKVVSKFDTASSEHDIATMRQCVSIMAHFVRGSDTLVHVSDNRRSFYLPVSMMYFVVGVVMGE
jgi:hypothetical protein